MEARPSMARHGDMVRRRVLRWCPILAVVARVGKLVLFLILHLMLFLLLRLRCHPEQRVRRTRHGFASRGREGPLPRHQQPLQQKVTNNQCPTQRTLR